MKGWYSGLARTFVLAMLVVGCGGGGGGDDDGGSGDQVEEFVDDLQVVGFGSIAMRLDGDPPPPSGGPAVTVTDRVDVAEGGTTQVDLDASAPFTTIFVSVEDGPVDGYFQIDLGSVAVQSATVELSLQASLPSDEFDFVFSVADADGNVGAPASTVAEVIGGTGEPPDVSGTRFLANPSLSSSNCPDEVDDAVITLFAAAGSCEYSVEQDGSDVDIENQCGGTARFQGEVDEEGNVDADWDFEASDSGCTVSGEANLRGDLSMPAARVTITLPVNFSGDCGGVDDCTFSFVADFDEGSFAASPSGNRSAARSGSLSGPLPRVVGELLE
jgi:hypothetical protein